MKRFGYFRDPLCVVACALYVLNRLWWRGQFGGEFLAGYFNDVLLIPAALITASGMAMLPARSAARVRAADALRAE